jgi:hypothetical protein
MQAVHTYIPAHAILEDFRSVDDDADNDVAHDDVDDDDENA